MSLSLPLDLPSTSKFSDNLQSLSLHYKKLLADYEPVVDEARAQLQAVEVLLQGTTKSLTLPNKSVPTLSIVSNSDVVKQDGSRPWWEEITGTFADDSAYDEAMQLGREYRNSLSSTSILKD